MKSLKEELNELIARRNGIIVDDLEAIEKELLDIFYSIDYRDAIIAGDINEDDYESLAKQLDDIYN